MDLFSQPPHERFILTGYMGAGKSTIGRMLATAINYRFFDTDRQVMRHFNKTVSKIFAEDGEERFREVERMILSNLLQFSKVVISTGGGTLVTEENFSLAYANGIVIYLQAHIDTLYERAIFSRKDRPILNVPHSDQVFAEKFKERESFYLRSHVVVSTENKHSSEVVAEILQALALGKEHLRLKNEDL